jgi:transcriptional regulator with XRE-family HTH domain
MISTRLKELRQQLGLSQTDFAHKAKVSQPMIAAIEKGEKALSEKIMQRVCKEFKLPRDYFIKPQPFNETETNHFVKDFSTLSRGDQELLQSILQKMILLKRLTSGPSIQSKEKGQPQD